MQNLIYGLQDPHTDDFYYVGKSTCGLDRPQQHLNGSHNWLVRDWVIALSNDNVVPRIVVLEECNDASFLLAKEKFWIKKMIEEKQPLLNMLVYEDNFEKYRTLKELEKEFDNKIKEIENRINLIKEQDNGTMGDCIKKRRKELKATQDDIAGICGLSVNTIYKIERNQAHPTLNTINILLDVLGLKLGVYLKNIG